jgi:general secretion pathway protein D
LRVREGEVALIGGVTKQQDDLTVTGIPGLSKIPILGKLFSGKTANRSTDEMMVVLIPHIIRRPEYTPDNLRSIGVGTAQSISLRRAPAKPLDIHIDGEIPARVEYTPVAPGADPAVPLPAVAAPPATAPPATAPPAAPLPATSFPGLPGGAKPGAPAARIRFNPVQMDTGVNTAVAVSVVLEGGQDVAAAPMVIRFDPKMLRLEDVTPGGFLASDGQAPVLTKNVNNDQGTATVLLNRPPGLSGVSGPAGVLVNLSFRTLGPGSAKVAIPSVSVRDSQGLPIAIGTPGELTLSIH